MIEIPSPDQIKAARLSAGLTQDAAAELIYSKRRTWQDWELGKAKMQPGLLELFLLLADQHPDFTLEPKTTRQSSVRRGTGQSSAK